MKYVGEAESGGRAACSAPKDLDTDNCQTDGNEDHGKILMVAYSYDFLDTFTVIFSICWCTLLCNQF